MVQLGSMAYRGNWLLSRMLGDRGQTVAAFVAMDLHFAVPDRSGFSLVAFREQATRYRFASPGRVTAWAASLRMMGYLAAGPAKRQQRVVPTPKFFAMVRARLQRIWQPIALIHLPALEAIALLEDESFLCHIGAGRMALFRNGHRVFHSVPELTAIADRQNGIGILVSILVQDTAGETFTVAGLARHYVVSRAHVRSILEAAAASGLLTRTTPGGGYRVEARLKTALHRYVASLFQTHIATLDYALAMRAARAASVEPSAQLAQPGLPPPHGAALYPQPAP